MKQTETILAHLRSHKSITPLESWREYGCYRLADVVFKLRRKGHDIITEDIEEKGARFARYSLREAA